jgi:hypothetical protein
VPPANVKGKKRNAAMAALDSVEAAADDSLRRGRRLRKSPQVGLCIVPMLRA